jgi:nucleotide-binding universal stress UspA family protein
MRLLVTLDGSHLSEEVIATVERLCAEASDCSVEMLQVLDPMAARGTIHLLVEDEEATEYVEAQAQKLRELGIDASGRVDIGPPARQILERIANGGFDYICMATHGRSGLARAALGSVTDRVVRESSVPVIVIHPDAGVPARA